MGRPPKNGGPPFRFNPAEVAEMETVLQEHNTQLPTVALLQDLADNFSLAPERLGKVEVKAKQVRDWFQNRRYAIRTNGAKTLVNSPVSSTPRENSTAGRNMSQVPQPVNVYAGGIASTENGTIQEAFLQETARVQEAILATWRGQGIYQGAKDTEGLRDEAPAAQVHTSAVAEYHFDLRSPEGLNSEGLRREDGEFAQGVVWSSAASSQTKLVPNSAPLPAGYEDREAQVDAGIAVIPPLREIIRGVGLSEAHVRVLARIRLGKRETFKDILQVPPLSRLSVLTLLCTTLEALDQKSPPTISVGDAEYLHGGLGALRDSPLQVEWLIKRVEDVFNQVSLAAAKRQVKSLGTERVILQTQLAHVDQMEAALKAEIDDRASRPGVVLREDDSLSAGLL